MEPTKPKTLDEQWNEVSQKAGITPREHYQLAVRVFFSDSNRKKDVLERMQMDFQEHQMNFQTRQLQLFEIQTVNENMQQRLLAFRLNRKMNALARREKIKAMFAKFIISPLAKGYTYIISLLKKPKPNPNDTPNPIPQGPGR